MGIKKALVADDQKINRVFIKTFLVTKGYEVDTAEDGLEALNKAKESSYNLIFSDIEMPNMNGLEFLKNIKREPEYMKVPVVMLSTVDKPEIIDRAMKMGAAHYMIKPFTTEKMDEAFLIIDKL
ncbi:MAG: response regulator [Spirochaetota bacterium]|nr:response regulator [Spirochaetota bacterium]